MSGDRKAPLEGTPERTAVAAQPGAAAPTGLRIAIVGAESTGKTALAEQLALRLAGRTGWPSTWVPEWLRAWCDREGRTPRRDEQRAIAEQQQVLIEAAAARHALVVCDTTPLMTAVYSRLLFWDTSLDGYALARQREVTLTLVTAPDIPWVADGLQRDGPQVRGPVDEAVRELLTEHHLPWARVTGEGEARVDNAEAAVMAHLRGKGLWRAPPGALRTNA